jgi:hypothetical protein
MALILLGGDIDIEMGETVNSHSILTSLHSQMSELEEADESGEGGWRCICHKIQCAVLAGLQQAGEIVQTDIAVIKQLAVTLKLSPLKWSQVYRFCNELGMKGNKVQMDCPTRWSGLYYMLLSIIELWPAVFRSAQEGDFDDYPTEHTFPTSNLKSIFLLFFNF